MGVADSPLRDRVLFIEGARSGTKRGSSSCSRRTRRSRAWLPAESHLFDFGLDRLFDNFEQRHLPFAARNVELHAARRAR